MIGYLKRATKKQNRYLVDYFFQGYRRAASPATKIGSITALPLLLFMGCIAGTFSELAAAAPSPKLLFKSNFGYGVSLGKPYSRGTNGTPQYDFNAKGVYQNLTGKDVETRYTWPPVAALGAYFSGVQLIAPVPVTPSTLSQYNIARIYGTYGPNGGQTTELFLNTANNGGVGNAASAQTDFLIERPWDIGDVTNLYTTFWVKFPANLASSLDPSVSSGNWKTLTEFKTGGAVDPVSGKQYGGGDYRIQVAVLKNKKEELYWRTAGDDGANWKTVDSAGKVINCPQAVNALVCPLNIYWKVENHAVPVPVGRWAKVEVYWHRSSGEDGRYWAAVNGEVIVDYHGSTMGKFNLPITRIFSTLDYSGGHSSGDQSSSGTHTTGLEYWDGFPCGDGVSCY
ncbi:MAG: hypothetical protein K8R50_11900 [Betaproteobacteria bacterium]|nr:hypothetical protein [Betaproteobacteria bacterium]